MFLFLLVVLSVLKEGALFQQFSRARSQSKQTLNNSVNGDPLRNKTNAKLEWLEGNSWLIEVEGVKLLLDPVFDTLDFGMPSLYKGDKKFFKNYEELTESIGKKADHLVITQGLADHCCSKTIPRLAKVLKKSARIIAPPSAFPFISKSFPSDRVTYVRPNDQVVLKGENGGEISVVTFQGSQVGPPTQEHENGYIFRKKGADAGGIFIEPHCMWTEKSIAGLKADVVLTPTFGQRLGPEILHYTILRSGEPAVELARKLEAKKIVSFHNADAETSGFLTKVITQTGDEHEFEKLANQNGIEFIRVEAGLALEV
mmetsp:Transcript_1033/g.1562  ORF Transcript_1033/g.1562 Transcript_1033/m.1562 type:complete len:314 (+) Transcript_1033:85-1026(+)